MSNMISLVNPMSEHHQSSTGWQCCFGTWQVTNYVQPFTVLPVISTLGNQSRWLTCWDWNAKTSSGTVNKETWNRENAAATVTMWSDIWVVFYLCKLGSRQSSHQGLVRHPWSTGFVNPSTPHFQDHWWLGSSFTTFQWMVVSSPKKWFISFLVLEQIGICSESDPECIYIYI